MADSKLPLSTSEHVAKQFKQVRPLLSLAGLFSRDFRARSQELENQFAEVEQMKARQAAFASRFGPRGWTVFDRLSTEAVKAAVLEADNEVAERGLIAYHLNPDTLVFMGYRFKTSLFEPWQDLYERAIERAAAEDYLSSVPLVLIIIDGICTSKTQKHPFSGGTDAPVFDTETTGPGGLPSGLAAFGAVRRKLDGSAIDNPYRHGIMHGLNPNYGSPLVAAKAFNLLHALVDYFDKRADEAARIAKATEDQRGRTWSEIATTAAATKDMQRRIDAWTARPARSSDIAVYGETRALVAGTPEEAAAQYLDAIIARNFGTIAGYMINYPLDPIKQRAGRHREELGEIVLTSWRMVRVRDEAPAVSEADIELYGTYQGRNWSGTQTMRLIFGDEKFDALVRGTPGGSWSVLPNFLNNLWGTVTKSIREQGT